MKKAIEFKITGIKCDHCDYRDMTVKYEDYPMWLNKPCPKCGAILLTEKDLKATKTLIKIANIINKIIPATKSNEEIITGRVEMDGTGKVDFKINKDKTNTTL